MGNEETSQLKGDDLKMTPLDKSNSTPRLESEVKSYRDFPLNKEVNMDSLEMCIEEIKLGKMVGDKVSDYIRYDNYSDNSFINLAYWEYDFIHF